MYEIYDDLSQLLQKTHPYSNLPGFIDKLYEQIRNRLGNFFPIVRSWVAEGEYIEREWRGIYSIYYSKTFYKKTSPFVTRIHLLSEKVENIDLINDNNYIGYITLRPIPVDKCALSKIIVRPVKSTFGLKDEEQLFILSVPFKSHLGGREFEVNTFPFLNQDSMATVCAHADIIMMACYLHEQFPDEFPLLKIKDLFEISYQERYLPSRGITAYQFTEILYRNDYNSFLKLFERGDIEKLVDFIDSQIESALPVVLAFDGHVSLLIGHTLDKNGHKKYILYDDSGYHFRNAFNIADKPAFFAIITIDDLRRI